LGPMRMILVMALTFALGSCTGAHHAGTGRAFNVREFGAVGDGRAKDTAALQRALDACAAKGGEVVVPAGTYLTGSLVVRGGTTVRLTEGATLKGSPDKGDYPIEDVRWEGRWRPGHRAMLSAEHAKHVSIVGPGAIEGPPFELANLRNPRGPCLIETVDCSGVVLDGFSTNYRRMWSIHLTDSSNIICANLHVRSDPKPSNGDGIDLDSCTDVKIHHCDIDAGDDAIALKSGRGMEGFTAARPTRDVTISDCTLGSSFAGLAVGTEMSGGIRDIKVTRCTFTRGSNAIFIKSRLGRGGAIRNINCSDLNAAGPKCFLRIDLLTKGIQDEHPVEGRDGIPSASDLRFTDINSTCDIFCDATLTPPEKPIQNFTIQNVAGSTTRRVAISNVRNAVLEDIHLTGVTGPLLRLKNVTGPGLKQ
jgi:polygalacturonase